MFYNNYSKNRTIKGTIKDGTKRRYYCKVEGYRDESGVELMGMLSKTSTLIQNCLVESGDQPTFIKVASVVLNYSSVLGVVRN